MAQKTNDPTLLHQIMAGTKGRRKGHSYESEIAAKVRKTPMPYFRKDDADKGIIRCGSPVVILLDKTLDLLNWDRCDGVEAYATGRLATSERGHQPVVIDGQPVTSAKSDVILVMHRGEQKRVVGVSVKQCNNRTPTNAQVYFTTASAFHKLLNDNGIRLSEQALTAMRQFCGDAGFRPADMMDCSCRVSSPERYFWEETDAAGRAEWERAFADHQDEVTRLLLQKGYSGDPFPPDIILHKTRRAESFDHQEIAVFTMDEFIGLSRRYSSFATSPYRVKKGRFKEPEGIVHLAPRFGVVQMQRGGQKQHPTQLQFNLKAGYFNELSSL